MNFDEPSHEQTTPHGGKCLFINKNVETFASFDQDTENRVPEPAFGPLFFFDGNFKDQNNSCVT